LTPTFYGKSANSQALASDRISSRGMAVQEAQNGTNRYRGMVACLGPVWPSNIPSQLACACRTRPSTTSPRPARTRLAGRCGAIGPEGISMLTLPAIFARRLKPPASSVPCPTTSAVLVQSFLSRFHLLRPLQGPAGPLWRQGSVIEGGTAPVNPFTRPWGVVAARASTAHCCQVCLLAPPEGSLLPFRFEVACGPSPWPPPLFSPQHAAGTASTPLSRTAASPSPGWRAEEALARAPGSHVLGARDAYTPGRFSTGQDKGGKPVDSLPRTASFSGRTSGSQVRHRPANRFGGVVSGAPVPRHAVAQPAPA